VTASCPRCAAALAPGGGPCPGCGFDPQKDHPPPTTYLPPDQAPPVPNSELELLRQGTAGEYEIITELGKGGMATVYLAHDVALNRKVALKVISTAMIVQPAVAERFKREARTAGALSHPNIIPVHAVRETDTLLYFVMKYVPGRSLDRVVLDGTRLSIAAIGTILGEAGAALDYAHRQGVIHRDVKPGNIMIDEEGRAHLTDFGIAKAAETEGLTRTGTVVGTPTYLCPEVCQGHDVSVLSDQYSLGVVAYELVAGRAPFKASSQVGLMYAQIHEKPRQLRSLRPDCPPELEAAVHRMLAKEPAARWPSMKEAAQAITGAVPPPDDAVRAEISALAQQRPERELLAGWSSHPHAVAPAIRRTPGANPSISPMPIPVVTVRHSRWPLVTGGLLAVLGLFALWRISPSSRPYTPELATRGRGNDDSLWFEARGGALALRQQAVAAGATAADLASGDSLRAHAESLAQTGNRSEAAVTITRATTEWSVAASNRRAGQPARPAPPPAAGATAPAAAPRTMGDSDIVVDFYARMGGFIRAQQLNDLKGLLSSMSATEEERWRAWFKDDRVATITQSDTVRKVTRRGDFLYATLDRILTITKDSRDDVRRSRVQVVLSLGPDGWRQISAQTVK
jgi:serine/threonine protein kinase